jgi:hypothetical protein
MTVAEQVLHGKREDILQLAARYGARRVRIFGSVARGDATPQSDIDFLVSFEPERSLLDLIGFKQEVQELLGRPVDVISEGGISPHLRDRILQEAQPL